MKEDQKETTSTLLGVDSETGKIPEQRVPDAESARNMFLTALSADQESADNRTIIQGMLDGDPPYDPNILKETGQSNRTNVNFKGAKNAFEKIKSSYLDVVMSSSNLISVYTRYGRENNQHVGYSLALSQIITEAFLDWPQFIVREQELCRWNVYHGLGIAYFEDPNVWTYEVAGLDDFTFPRNTKPDETKLEIVFGSRKVKAHELYGKIRDKKIAKEMGWNVDAVMDVLKWASNADSADKGDRAFQSSTDFQRAMKNNDLGMTDTIGSDIRLVYIWVKEFDESITYLIIHENNSGGKCAGDSEFLFRKPKAYKKMEDAFVLFPLGNGTNDYIHSLRGVGNDLYAVFASTNRIKSQMVDVTLQNTATYLRPNSETARIEAALVPFGPFTLLDKDIDIVPSTPPNIGNVAGPTLQMLEEITSQRIGSIDNLEGSRESRNQFESEVRMGAATAISESQIKENFTYRTKLYKQIVRRWVEGGPDGYPKNREGYFILEQIFKKMEDVNIPKEAFYGIQWEFTKAVPALGNGSAFQRKMALEQLQPMRPFLDEEGQQKLTRYTVEAAVGTSLANILCPDVPVERQDVNQVKVALMENDNILLLQKEIEVLSGEDHLVHVEQHAREIVALVQQGDESKEALMSIVQTLSILLTHYMGHMAYLENQGKDNVPNLGAYKEVQQQAEEAVNNGFKALQAQQRKEAQQAEAQAMQQQAPQGGEQPNTEQIKQENALALQQAKADMELQHKRALNELAEQNRVAELRHKEAMNALNIAQKDAETAAKIPNTI